MEEHNWLSHVSRETTVGATNKNHLCGYLIALEGWRRGLKLTWYSKKVTKRNIHAPGRYFSLSSKTRTRYFYKTKGDEHTPEAHRVTANKEEAKKWLSNKNVRVPKGKRFTKKYSDDEILECIKQFDFPLVLKPTYGYQGIGVFVDIQNQEEFREAMYHVRHKLKYKDVLVEEFIKGKEYRLFVLKDEVLAVLYRIPANVKGDGIRTIKKLIDAKNSERKKNPRLKATLIKVDNEVINILNKQGYTLDSVPEKDKRIFLRANSNISTGGDSVDVTDEFPIEIKREAIKALNAIPGLPHAGIDIIVEDNMPYDRAGVVLEINQTPQIGSLLFPMIGQARDVPSALIDYYFPETKDKENFNPRVFFDFKKVLSILINKTASDVTVTPAPKPDMIAKKYIIHGKVQGVGYRKWIRRRAIEEDLHGYTQNLNNGTVVVVVAGKKEDVVAFKDVCYEGSKRSNVSEVLDEDWDRAIKVGFEIKATPKKKKKQVKKKPIKKQALHTRLFNVVKKKLGNIN